MPRHLISDAHEWTNKIIAVFYNFLVKLLLKERFWRKQRGKKSLLSLTLFFFYFIINYVVYEGEKIENEIPFSCNIKYYDKKMEV